MRNSKCGGRLHSLAAQLKTNSTAVPALLAGQVRPRVCFAGHKHERSASTSVHGRSSLIRQLCLSCPGSARCLEAQRGAARRRVRGGGSRGDKVRGSWLGSTAERGVLRRRPERWREVVARLRWTGFVSAVVLLLLGTLTVLTGRSVAADSSPTITAVSPEVGAIAGGTTVTISGTGFVDGATSVDFGPTPAVDITVSSSTTLSATSPANAAGSFDITVTTSGAGGGTSTISPADLFAYGPPTVTAVSPDGGPLLGGTVVTVTGTAFVPGAAVSFGTTAATDVSVVSATTLKATSPAGVSDGPVDVTVATPGSAGGTSPISPSDLFAYGPPTVTQISPGAGPIAGGTAVAITGTSFAPGATVSFGTVAATDINVSSSTTLVATAPAGTEAGVVDVTVATPGSDGGTSSSSVADLYSYEAPAVTTISPTTGPAATATTVTITGTGFSPGDTVDFGTTPVSDVTVWGATVITASSPATFTGGADITVSNALGTSATSVNDQFAAGAPTVASVSPAAGPLGGGGTVTVRGDGFVAGTAVAFGGSPATSVTVVSPTMLLASVPSSGVGSVDVSVTTSQGSSARSVADLYAYGVPMVTAVSPDTSSTVGGNQVVITGSGFVPGAVVSFGRVEVGGTVNGSGTSLQVTAPPGAAGSVNVTVTTPAGTSATSIQDLFAYGAPVVTSVAPDAGPLAGGNDVIVAGDGFVSGMTVYFGSQMSPSVTVLAGGTGFYAVAPAGTAGPVDITVTTPQGTSAASLNDTYFYGTPVVTAITPAIGATAGGTAVTITGSGFAPDATVSFGLLPATSVTVTSSTSITAVAPAANAGVIPVRVGTEAGITPLTPVDNFEYDDSLQISCAPPPAVISTCNGIDLPPVSLDGQWQSESAPSNTLYVTDDRRNASVGWSVSAYMEPSPQNPNALCDGFAGFCNTSAGSGAANTNAVIPADDFSITDVGCSPGSGNTSPAPLAGSGGAFPNGPGAVALCTAQAGSSAGTFSIAATYTLHVPPWIYAGRYEASIEILVM